MQKEFGENFHFEDFASDHCSHVLGQFWSQTPNSLLANMCEYFTPSKTAKIWTPKDA